jgi:UDP-N-acetylmuramate dehydrogenase
MNVPELNLRSVSDAVIHIRRSKLPDPKEIGNAGSFFKNPEIPTHQFEALQAKFPSVPGYVTSPDTVKVPAGWLIEQAGWKGKIVGKAGVHKNQALVLVNYGGAQGKEIKALAEQVQHSVLEKFGITLQPEVNFI